MESQAEKTSNIQLETGIVCGKCVDPELLYVCKGEVRKGIWGLLRALHSLVHVSARSLFVHFQTQENPARGGLTVHSRCQE